MSARSDPATTDDGRPAMIGGYRVVRAIGTGTRATVWVGHSGRAVQRADVPTVALKVFANADDDSIAAEIAAYESVESQHVVRLLDVCSAGESRIGSAVCVVLEWLGEGSLATLVRQRRRIRAGEAVTVLVSVLRGIRDVHAAGFAHNAVLPKNVLFDGMGRPVLSSLGHATRLPPAYSDAAMEGRAADWAQLLSVLDLVLGRVEVDGREDELDDIRRALGELALARDEREWCDQAEDALYAFAQPAPLVLHATSIPGAVHRSGPDAPERVAPPRRSDRRVFGADLAARTEAILDVGPMHTLKGAVAPALRKRRKQLVFGAVLASVVGVAGLAAIPPGDAGSDLKRGASEHAQQTGTSRPSTVASTPATDAPSAPAEMAADPITADEPVAAVVALLTSRAHCFAQQSDTCLKLVDQDASPLLEADTSAVKQRDSPPELFTANASLVERTGNSALVELGPQDQASHSQAGRAQSASVLAIKDQNGWQLREIFSS